MGALLGTPAYMAPEQIQGMKVDHRADIWSFCASLYEALYCELPFPGRTAREVQRHIALGSVRRVPLGSQVPDWLRQAVLRGLEARRDARYATMDDALIALRTRRNTRHRSRVAVVVGAGGFAVLGGFGAVWLGRPATHQTGTVLQETISSTVASRLATYEAEIGSAATTPVLSLEPPAVASACGHPPDEFVEQTLLGATRRDMVPRTRGVTSRPKAASAPLHAAAPTAALDTDSPGPIENPSTFLSHEAPIIHD
jgi:serine/threonine protein kinase